MSQLHELTRFLLAAGGASPMEEEGVYLLYVEDSTLISKHWTGTTFGSQELISTSVLEGSPAAYLITPETKRIVCISSSLVIKTLIYDDDAEEWVEEEEIGSHKVHPKSKIAGSIGEDGQQDLVFQDPSGRLVHLNRAWKPTLLPVNAVEGTPLAASANENNVDIFYVSAGDKKIHYVTQQRGGKWKDSVFSDYAFNDKETPKRFIVSTRDDGSSEVFLLTEQKAISQIVASGQKVSLGTVSAAGEWVPTTKEECFILIFLCVGGGRRHGGRRRRNCW